MRSDVELDMSQLQLVCDETKKSKLHAGDSRRWPRLEFDRATTLSPASFGKKPDTPK